MFFLPFQASAAIEVDINNFRESQPCCSEPVDVSQKASILDGLYENLTEKISQAGYQEKVQMLTLAPEEWSLRKKSNQFHVSRYLVKKAQQQKSEFGILSSPPKKVGHSLSTEVLARVRNHFEDDDHSR